MDIMVTDVLLGGTNIHKNANQNNKDIITAVLDLTNYIHKCLGRAKYFFLRRKQ